MLLESAIDNVMTYDKLESAIIAQHKETYAYKNYKTDSDSRYLDYILDHKLNLAKVFIYLVNRDSDDFNLYAKELRARIIEHDMSKYSEEEFIPYRNKFFPVDGKLSEEEIEVEFNKAWEHHWKNNRHHYKMYIHDDKPMGKIDMLEFIIDISAMGYKFNNCPMNRYAEVEQEKIKSYNVNRNYIGYHISCVKDIHILMNNDIVCESKLSSSERKEIPDRQWGLPIQRKFPLIDATHIRSAESYFRTCAEEYKPTLAANLYRRNLELGLKMNPDAVWYSYIPKEVMGKNVNDKSFTPFMSA